MPKKRLPNELWQPKRREIWLRDGGICQSPPGKHKQFCTGDKVIPLNECHIDHIRSGKLGTNANSNLRVLCPSCHGLRIDYRHRALTSRLVNKGILPVNWREYVWE